MRLTNHDMSWDTRPHLQWYIMFFCRRENCLSRELSWELSVQVKSYYSNYKSGNWPTKPRNSHFDARTPCLQNRKGKWPSLKQFMYSWYVMKWLRIDWVNKHLFHCLLVSDKTYNCCTAMFFSRKLHYVLKNKIHSSQKMQFLHYIKISAKAKIVVGPPGLLLYLWHNSPSCLKHSCFCTCGQLWSAKHKEINILKYFSCEAQANLCYVCISA